VNEDEDNLESCENCREKFCLLQIRISRDGHFHCDRCTEKPQTMTFTKTPPTRPGAYWFRNKERLQNFLCDYDKNDIALLKTSTIKGEWCGPLVPVEEVEKAYKEGWSTCYGFPQLGEYGQKEFNIDYPLSRARRMVEGYVV